mmetsp:Transcript_12568/g.29433  ORF Transcript_12568/g.29433 Transcript_12568/m.29433 type:complete len:1011 (-) Transcript_12568:97-3129(-)
MGRDRNKSTTYSNEDGTESTKSKQESNDEGGDTADDNSNSDENTTKKRSWKDRISFRRKKEQKNDDEQSDENNDNAVVSDADAMSTAQQSMGTRTTQANRHTRTIEDCETEYHESVREHDWDYLEGLLKEYDSELYKKRKKQPKKKKNLKILKYVPKLDRFKKEKVELETPVSPLLALDHEGRTPLHLCCVEPTPAKVLIRLMNCERDAAAIKDKQGLLPLHLAIQHRRGLNVIERLVRVYYQGSWTGDDKNRTPLTMATEVVVEKQKEGKIEPTTTFWGFPTSPEDIKWQEDQRKIWSVAEFLVKNRYDRRKKLLTVEHNQIFVALNRCGPPELIANLLSTGRTHMIKTDVAGKVLFLLISRQYPLFLIQWYFTVISGPFIKEQQDALGYGVVAAQFRVGCLVHKNQDSSLDRDSFVMTMKRNAQSRQNREEIVPTPQYTEWWVKLKSFINLWTTHLAMEGDSAIVSTDEQILLHNTLLNPDVPPLLIQLLANLYPESILNVHPKLRSLPIHLACRHWQFRYYPRRKGEIPFSLDKVCQEFLKHDETQTRKRYKNRLPLHHAIAVSKPWEFIRPLVSHDPKSVVLRDPVTKLRPFQMAAVKVQEAFDIEAITRRGYTPKVWNDMSDEDQDCQMRKVLDHYDLLQLELIYELLHHSPDAVKKMKSSQEMLSSKKKNKNKDSQDTHAHIQLVSMIETKMVRNLFGVGNVEGHFIGWCYEMDSTDSWRPHRRNFAMVKEAIMDGFVPNGMNKWWTKLKFWLWQDCPWDNIPRRADFLLHCALCNPKVSPWIVELILECFPRSAAIPLPNSDGCYPLHIACITETYSPLPFEFPNKRSVIELVSIAFHEAILMKWKDRLPLHYAILGAKQWEEMRSIAEDEPVSLAIPDSESDFFPFQLRALQKASSRSLIQRFQDSIKLWEREGYSGASMNIAGGDMSGKRSDELIDEVEIDDREMIGCTFELLKRNPMLVHVGTVDSRNRGGASVDNATDDDSIQLESFFDRSVLLSRWSG